MEKSRALEKILLVDDNQLFFNLLSGRLARKGIILFWARDGYEAIKIYKKERPPIIVTDIVMPKINGFELIRRIKSLKEDFDSVFIILSEWGEARLVYDRDFLKSLGIVRYLVKSSYSPADIANEICSILAYETKKR